MSLPVWIPSSAHMRVAPTQQVSLQLTHTYRFFLFGLIDRDRASMYNKQLHASLRRRPDSFRVTGKHSCLKAVRSTASVPAIHQPWSEFSPLARRSVMRENATQPYAEPSRHVRYRRGQYC